MRAYRDDPARTADAFDADGWLQTGDLAQIDDAGYVRIVDRKKELIINSAGKNMSPANIEAKLTSASPLIGQAVCIGDARPYNVALLVLDPDALAAHARGHGLAGRLRAAIAGRTPSPRRWPRRCSGPTRGSPGSSRSSATACSTTSGCPAATS